MIANQTSKQAISIKYKLFYQNHNNYCSIVFVILVKFTVMNNIKSNK